MVAQVTMATSMACGFPTQSFPRALTHKNIRLKCPILIETGMFRQILVKLPFVKFHENPSTGSRVFMETDGRVERF
jgi:hypothetical protein